MGQLLSGLAIPHVVVEGREEFEILVARSRDGIRFPGQRERVHAVFVLVGSDDEHTFHLRALAAIARIVQWPEFEARWLTARDAEALRVLLLRASRRHVSEKALTS